MTHPSLQPAEQTWGEWVQEGIHGLAKGVADTLEGTAIPTPLGFSTGEIGKLARGLSTATESQADKDAKLMLEMELERKEEEREARMDDRAAQRAQRYQRPAQPAMQYLPRPQVSPMVSAGEPRGAGFLQRTLDPTPIRLPTTKEAPKKSKKVAKKSKKVAKKKQQKKKASKK